MKKDYEKPEIEYIELAVQEAITSDDMVDGSMDLEDSIF